MLLHVMPFFNKIIDSLFKSNSSFASKTLKLHFQKLIKVLTMLKINGWMETFHYHTTPHVTSSHCKGIRETILNWMLHYWGNLTSTTCYDFVW